MIDEAGAAPAGWQDGPVEIVLGEPVQNPEHVLALGVESRNKYCLFIIQLESTFTAREILRYIWESKHT
jgi:hypothetical protein